MQNLSIILKRFRTRSCESSVFSHSFTNTHCFSFNSSSIDICWTFTLFYVWCNWFKTHLALLTYLSLFVTVVILPYGTSGFL